MPFSRIGSEQSSSLSFLLYRKVHVETWGIWGEGDPTLLRVRNQSKKKYFPTRYHFNLVVYSMLAGSAFFLNIPNNLNHCTQSLHVQQKHVDMFEMDFKVYHVASRSVAILYSLAYPIMRRERIELVYNSQQYL